MPHFVPDPPLIYLLSFFSSALTRASAAENAALLILFYLLSFFSKALTRASAAENAALRAKCSFSLAVRCFSASMT
jgi:hypothetical protein